MRFLETSRIIIMEGGRVSFCLYNTRVLRITHLCCLDVFIFRTSKKQCPPKTGMSPRILLTGIECPPKVKS